METLKSTSTYQKVYLEKAKVLTIIPIRGKTTFVNESSLLELAIKSSLIKNFKNDIIVLTDNENTANLAKSFKNVNVLMRPVFLSSKFVSDQELLSFAVKELEKKNKIYDLVVSIKETYPFRNQKLITNMISSLLNNNFDTIIAAKYEERKVWQTDSENKTKISSENFVPRDLKKL